MGCCALLVYDGIDGEKVLNRVYQPSTNTSEFPTLLVTTNGLLIMYHKSTNPSRNRPAPMRYSLAWIQKRVTIHDCGIDASNTVVSSQHTPGISQPMKVSREVRNGNIGHFYWGFGENIRAGQRYTVVTSEKVIP